MSLPWLEAGRWDALRTEALHRTDGYCEDCGHRRITVVAWAREPVEGAPSPLDLTCLCHACFSRRKQEDHQPVQPPKPKSLRQQKNARRLKQLRTGQVPTPPPNPPVPANPNWSFRDTLLASFRRP